MTAETKNLYQQTLLEKYATRIGDFYDAETLFIQNPTAETLWAYHVAFDRFAALRAEVVRLSRLGDAIAAPPLSSPGGTV